MSTLLIDAGNSRVKLARLECGRWLWEGVSDHANLATLLHQIAAPRRVLVSNVAGASVHESLVAACMRWEVEPEFIIAQPHQCGVSNGYQPPAALGCDRWAALLAAWHLQRRACLVVNCGTATTVDALSDQGEFLGGLILPGITLMQQSLWANTAQLREAEGTLSKFPNCTADAILSGAVAATAGAILRQYAQLAQPEAACILSGGAADSLVTELQALPLLRLDNLVLQGLQLIAQESGTP